MPDTTVHISILLQDLRDGKPGAIRALVDRAYPRLRALAAKILRESFPGITAVEVDEVVSEAYPRLVKALEATVLPTPADFFRLSAFKIRQTLLDLAAAYRRRKPVGSLEAGVGSSVGYDVAGSTGGADRSAIRNETTRVVDALLDELPDELKVVFVPHFYLDLTQAEVAEVTGLPPRQVSRLIGKALLLLGDKLGARPGGPAGQG